ncbi:MAG: YceI family protein [Sphingorhabdus sp.]
MTRDQELDTQVSSPRAARYSLAAMALHWMLALLLTFQLALGWQLHDLERGAAQFAGYQLHKTFGIIILLLSLARLAVRLWHRRPPAFVDSVWAARMAKLVHALLYVVMIGGPITGWIIVSTAKIKFPTLLFGVIPWPHLRVPNAWHEPAEGLHAALAWMFVALLVLHVAGALRHQFVKDENILARMIPAALATRKTALIAAVMATGVLGAGYAVGSALDFLDAPVRPAVTPKPLPAATNATKTDTAREEANAEAEAASKAKEEDNLAKTDVAEPLTDWSIAQGGRLGFVATWNGQPVHGSFGRWTGNVRFSPDDLAHSTIRAEIDLASTDTSDSQRDDMLRGGDFFNVAVHPTAVFSASSMRRLVSNRYRASGSLAMHGASRPLTLDFTLDIKGYVARVSGSTRLNRTSFGVGSGEWAETDEIADAVAVTFAFSAHRK